MSGAPPDPELAGRVGRALGCIDDPCLKAAGIPGSIVELGLVQDVRANADGAIEVDLSLTEMGCAFTHHLLDRVWQTVESVEGVTAATVTPTWTWSPSHIAGALSARLEVASAGLPDALGARRRQLPVLSV